MTITRRATTPHSTLLRWTSHIDETLSNRLDRRCNWYTAGARIFDNDTYVEHREYHVTQADDYGDVWTVKVNTDKDSTTLSAPFTEQYTSVDDAQSAAQRHADALHVDVAGYMRQRFSARAELLSHAEQCVADARRHAAVLNLAEASVLIRALSEQIAHVHVAVDWEDNLLTIVRFVDAQGADVDVWDVEDNARFDLIRDFLRTAHDLSTDSDMPLFTFREPGLNEDEYGSSKLTSPVFQTN